MLTSTGQGLQHFPTVPGSVSIRSLLKSIHLTSSSQLPTRCPEGSSLNTALLQERQSPMHQLTFIWTKISAPNDPRPNSRALLWSHSLSRRPPIVTPLHHVRPESVSFLFTSCLVHTNCKRQKRWLLRASNSRRSSCRNACLCVKHLTHSVASVCVLEIRVSNVQLSKKQTMCHVRVLLTYFWYEAREHFFMLFIFRAEVWNTGSNFQLPAKTGSFSSTFFFLPEKWMCLNLGHFKLFLLILVFMLS